MAETTTTPNPTVSAQIIKAFPMFADMLGIPEIATILENASQATVQATPQDLAAQIMGSQWWKTNSEAQRQYQVTKLTDPMTAADNAAQTALQVYNAGKTTGVALTPDMVSFITDQALNHNWNPAQITQGVVGNAQFKNLQAGSIEKNAQTFQATAADYGMPLSDQAAFTWGRQVASGATTPDAFNSYAQQQAKMMYPHLTNQIDAGFTVRQLADPYLQIAGQTLGKDPNEMLLSDPRWTAALAGRDAQGNPTGPMSQLQWTQHIMTDPQYGYANSANGRQAGLELAQNLASTFGVKTGGSQLV